MKAETRCSAEASASASREYAEVNSKWMKLEKDTTLCGVTQTQKDKHSMYSLINDIRYKVKDNQSKMHSSRRVR